MMRCHTRLLLLSAAGLLTACGSRPDLQANWYIVNVAPPLAAEKPSSDAASSITAKTPSTPPEPAASANATRESSLSYSELRTNSRMMVAILNRGEVPLELRKVVVNNRLLAPVETRPISHEKAPTAAPSASPSTLMDQAVRLPPGGLHILDATGYSLTRENDIENPARKRVRCQIPLWLDVEFVDDLRASAPLQRFSLRLPNPMPSALPEGWEFCGTLLPVDAPTRQ